MRELTEDERMLLRYRLAPSARRAGCLYYILGNREAPEYVSYGFTSSGGLG